MSFGCLIRAKIFNFSRVVTIDLQAILTKDCPSII
ncbi:uncharacterized protein METZ01_LOCUS37242 [marine metagenome]|uniref:Uncharacterized protein n=1 Tax=marine metagenome TaxID=408172 RepID=A0A381R0N6_9ZZZZ